METVLPNMVGYERLQALGVERLTAIRNRLERGDPVQSVAKMVQEEWGEFKDVKLKTFGQQLRRYKERFVDPKVPDVRDDLSNAYRGKLDTLKELEDLARIQRHRLDLLYTKEKTAQMLMGTNGRGEIRELATLYKEIQQLRFDLGLDVYYGQQGGGKIGVRTTLPDGTVVEAVAQSSPVEVATQQALEVLDNYGRHNGAADHKG